MTSDESTNKGMSHNEKTYLEILSDFTNKSLERKFANKQFGGFLVATNFTESHSSRPETMRLLDTTSSGSLYKGL